MRSRLRVTLAWLGRAGKGLLKGVKGVAGGLYRHDCLGLAAQVAYSVLFSLFPFLLIVNAVVSYVPGGQESLGRWVLGGLAGVVDSSSRLYEIVKNNIPAVIVVLRYYIICDPFCPQAISIICIRHAEQRRRIALI